VGVVSAAGRRPDEVAWELQRSALGKEVLLMMPMLLPILLNWMGLRTPDLALPLYMLGLWSALSLRLMWEPLRGEREEGIAETLKDLMFQAASFIQAFFFSMAVAVPLFAVLQECLLYLNLGRGPSELAGMLLSEFLVIPFVAGRLWRRAWRNESLREKGFPGFLQGLWKKQGGLSPLGNSGVLACGLSFGLL
jgi:hypothetical protein